MASFQPGLICFGKEEVSLIAPLDGSPPHSQETKWSGNLIELTFTHPYLYGLLDTGVLEIRNWYSGDLVQSFSFPNAKALVSGIDYTLIYSRDCIWRLTPLLFEEQVNYLILFIYS